MKDKTKVSVCMWDTAGSEQFDSMAAQTCRDATAAFLVFDLTSGKSLESVSKWFRMIKECASEMCQVVMVGNKLDLCKDIN